MTLTFQKCCGKYFLECEIFDVFCRQTARNQLKDEIKEEQEKVVEKGGGRVFTMVTNSWVLSDWSLVGHYSMVKCFLHIISTSKFGEMKFEIFFVAFIKIAVKYGL